MNSLAKMFSDPQDSLYTLYREHGVLIVEASEIFKRLIKEPANAEVYTKEITEVERQADVLKEKKKKMFQHDLSYTFYDKEDLEKLIDTSDRIINYIKKATELMVETYTLHKKSLGEQTELQIMANVLNEMTQLVQENCITNIAKLGSVKNITEIVATIETKERNVDKLYSAVEKRFFERAYTNPASVDVVLWLAWGKVYNPIEQAVDKTKHLIQIYLALYSKTSG